MIIWGWKVRELDQGTGEFFCPECQSQCDFKQVRVATYFTLYFIPLAETQHHGDYIQCLSCQQQYDPEVLNYEPEPPKPKRKIIKGSKTRRRCDDSGEAHSSRRQTPG